MRALLDTSFFVAVDSGLVADLWVRGRRVPVLDALIAATALAENMPVVTQDRDYDAMPGLTVISV